jgi:hypothetical protein
MWVNASVIHLAVLATYAENLVKCVFAVVAAQTGCSLLPQQYILVDLHKLMDLGVHFGYGLLKLFKIGCNQKQIIIKQPYFSFVLIEIILSFFLIVFFVQISPDRVNVEILSYFDHLLLDCGPKITYNLLHGLELLILGYLNFFYKLCVVWEKIFNLIFSNHVVMEAFGLIYCYFCFKFLLKK